ncbi:MAG: M20/M25/M40 family metallo-hydrolase, partial [Gemmatimonadota bacterium]
VVEGRPVYIGDWSAARIEAMIPDLTGAIVLTHQPQTVFTREDRPQPTEFDELVRTGAPRRASGETGESRTPLGTMRELLQEAGAAAMLRPSRGEHGTVYVLGNRNHPDDAVPSLVLAAEQYNMLVRMLRAELPVELRVEIQSRYHEDDPRSHNVIAELPGADPELRDEIVLIGAHLDSWHTAAGATDNADGVASAMEAMRILVSLETPPRRTIRIALWGGEEQGLLGSRAHVAEHFPEGSRGNEAVSVYFNDDPGTGPTYGFYMEENEEAKEIFDAWLKPFVGMGARRNVIQGIPSTDHLSFTRAGIPAFTAIKEYENYDTRTHHTNADHFERVRAADLR